ncbi:hypothetical protein H6501_05950 [Candidatus Woesearchaeota archaeon]|nr:hypothetical protein [Candidatus Woesearchaeota archaeon]
MILTKDNLLRFVRERKYVTPTHVAEAFDTTTMIGSAALSELVKDKLILVSFLKLGSTPFYYDPAQRECLMELAEKHFSKYDKEMYDKIRQFEVVNAGSLSVQEQLAVERIKDFAFPLELEYSGKTLRFWVWYLRNLDETRSQILQLLKEQSSSSDSVSAPVAEKTPKPKVSVASQSSSPKRAQPVEKVSLPVSEKKEKEVRSVSQGELSFVPAQGAGDDIDTFLENFFRQHYLNIEGKKKTEKGIFYEAVLRVQSFAICFDCLYYVKKPSEQDLLQFYGSSMRPKIVFVEAAPKKLFKLVESMDNFFLVNV